MMKMVRAMMKIHLNKHKAKEVNLASYFKKYSSESSKYELIRGAPLIISVEGTYILVSDLPSLCKPSVRTIVDRYVSALMHTNNMEPEQLEFIWNR